MDGSERKTKINLEKINFNMQNKKYQGTNIKTQREQQIYRMQVNRGNNIRNQLTIFEDLTQDRAENPA